MNSRFALVSALGVLSVSYLWLWVGFRRIIPFKAFPFFWAYFWATYLFNVVGSPWLVAEGWVTWQYVGGLAVLLAGFATTGLLLGVFKGPLRLSWEASQLEVRIDDRVAVGFSLAISVALIGLWVVMSGPPLLLSAGSGLTRLELIGLRTSAHFGEGANFHWFRPAFYVLPVVLAVYAFAKSRVQRSPRNSFVFGLAFLFAAGTSLAFLNKAPILVLFAAVGVAHYLMSGQVQTLRLMLLVGAGTVILVGLYVVYNSEFLSNSSWYVVILDRVFLAYPRAAAIAFSLWGDALPHLWGRTIVNPGGLLPYESVSLAAEIYPHAYRFSDGIGNAPAPSFAEGWVNFRWYGVWLFVGLSCSLVVVAQFLFRHLRASPLTLAILTILLYDFASMAMNSAFFTVLEPSRLVFYLTLFVLAKLKYRRPHTAVHGPERRKARQVIA